MNVHRFCITGSEGEFRGFRQVVRQMKAFCTAGLTDLDAVVFTLNKYRRNIDYIIVNRCKNTKRDSVFCRKTLLTTIDFLFPHWLRRDVTHIQQEIGKCLEICT